MEVSEQAVGAMQAYLRLKRYILPSGIAREALQAALPFIAPPSPARELVLEAGDLQELLERLDAGLEYEGWMETDGAPVELFDVEAAQDLFADAAAAIRALSSPDHADAGKVEWDGWLPIESAPKDGTVIQVWHQVHKCPISVLWKDDGFPYRGNRLNWYERTYTTAWPEHVFFYWRHLPSAPASE